MEIFHKIMCRMLKYLLIFLGPKGKKGKCCQGYPIRHYGVQLGVGIASGEGQLIGLAANRRRS